MREKTLGKRDGISKYAKHTLDKLYVAGRKREADSCFEYFGQLLIEDSKINEEINEQLRKRDVSTREDANKEFLLKTKDLMDDISSVESRIDELSDEISREKSKKKELYGIVSAISDKIIEEADAKSMKFAMEFKDDCDKRRIAMRNAVDDFLNERYGGKP